MTNEEKDQQLSAQPSGSAAPERQDLRDKTATSVARKRDGNVLLVTMEGDRWAQPLWVTGDPLPNILELPRKNPKIAVRVGGDPFVGLTMNTRRFSLSDLRHRDYDAVYLEYTKDVPAQISALVDAWRQPARPGTLYDSPDYRSARRDCASQLEALLSSQATERPSLLAAVDPAAGAQHSPATRDSDSSSCSILRAALFRLTSFPHACDSYFGEGADECVPCIAKRALDEASGK